LHDGIVPITPPRELERYSTTEIVIEIEMDEKIDLAVHVITHCRM
jgi:hypothetical protein